MPIRTLDLFHGAGGSSIGAKIAGAEIVAGIDFWDIATDSYSRNFPRAMAINADIRSISPSDLHLLIGDIDLILASPECTSHSCAKGAAIRDEESRLTAFQVIRFVKEFKPRWLIIENVIQMKSWVRHRELVEQIRSMDYYIQEEKLNARDFGVPQSRTRLFLVCSLYSMPVLREKNGKHIKPAFSIIDMSDKYQFSPVFNGRRARATIERTERAISALGSREPFLIVYYGTDGAGGWQSIEKPLRTVTTIDRFAFVKPSKSGHLMRMLQPEEIKLAMGFPKGYRLEAGTRRDKIKLMGNAVCPPVMRSIVKSVISN